MKASKLKTYSIIVQYILQTALICVKSVYKGLTKQTNRPWVDRTMHTWTDKILKLVQVDVTVVNPKNIKPKEGVPTIIMCNHSSLYDIPISIKAFPDSSIRMLAKKEMSKIPLMASGMRNAEFPFIDRKNRKQAIKDLEQAEALMKTGISLWVAPEGTRSPDGKLAPFKKGAFITAIKSNATIIPIGIRGAHDILPARTRQLNINIKAEVHVGEPIDASAYTLDNKQELIDKTHAVMQQLVGEGQNI